MTACVRPAGYTYNSNDCDDTNSDPAASLQITNYEDNDGDGIGGRALPDPVCPGLGPLVPPGDADDFDALVQ